MHTSGNAVNPDEIKDRDFGIVAQNSYRLKRKVEMYQWREIARTEDERTVYSYEKVWSETAIDSS